jgi:hypothetical protein
VRTKLILPSWPLRTIFAGFLEMLAGALSWCPLHDAVVLSRRLAPILRPSLHATATGFST